MVIVDLQTLRDAVKEELNRFNETDDRIDGFIQRCESSIRRAGRFLKKTGGITYFQEKGTDFAVIFSDIRVGTTIEEVQSVAVAGTQDVFDPSGFADQRGDSPKTSAQMNITHQADLATRRGLARGVAGRPSAVAVFEQSFLQFDIPADENYVYEAEVLLMEGLDFADPASTSRLLTTAPDLYLYGSLKATAPFFKDDSRLPLWSQLFEQARAELELVYERTKFPSTPIMEMPTNLAPTGMIRGPQDV